MSRARRSDAEIVAMVERHFSYEVAMLCFMARELADGTPYPRTMSDIRMKQLRNAVIEALPVHARVLLDFLYKDKPREDDMVAGDFFADPHVWVDVRPTMSPVLEDLKRRTDKEVVHLTYERLDREQGDRSWDGPQLATALLEVLQTWMRALPPSPGRDAVMRVLPDASVEPRAILVGLPR